jgi:heavy metal translocating P-type ATPase
MTASLDQRFKVTGIHCAGCVGRIRGALEKLPGVGWVRLGVDGDLMLNGEVTRERVLQTVEALGFKVENPEVLETTGRRGGEGAELVCAGILFVPLAVMTMTAHLFGFHGLAATEGWFAAVLSAGVVFGCAWRRWVAVWRTLFSGTLSMDVTVMTGGLVAWVVSLVGMRLGGSVYFESAAGLVFVQMLGRWIEARLRRQAGRAVEELVRLQPQQVTVVSGEERRRVLVGAMVSGDRFEVGMGERFPADGIVEFGESMSDVSWFTGESEPRRLFSGEGVVAGALNLGGAVIVRCVEPPSTSTISRMASLLRGAEEEGIRRYGIVERWVSHFSLGLLIVAFIAGFWCYRFGEKTVAEAFMRAATVLVAGCPCALGLAVPMVYRVASGEGLRAGILIRDFDALSRLASVTDIVLDKTGTLTEARGGRSEVEVFSGEDQRKVWAVAGGLESGSLHPFAESVRQHNIREGICSEPLTNVVERPGVGVEGQLDGVWWKLVRDEEGWSRMEREGVVVGRIRFAESLRKGIATVVRQLSAGGIRIHVASGDAEERVLAVGRALGVPDERCHFGMRPEGKLELIRSLKREGKRVVMIGDGVNDAAVLVSAHVGIAVSGASGVARASAHLELLRDGLEGLLQALGLSVLVGQALRQNLFLAIAYNVVTIPLASGWLIRGFGWDFSPMQASLAMTASSLLVVLNALRWGKSFGSVWQGR